MQEVAGLTLELDVVVFVEETAAADVAHDVFEVVLVAGAVQRKPVVGGADDDSTGHGGVRQSGEAVEEDTAAPIVVIVAGDAEGSVREDEPRKLQAHLVMRGGAPRAADGAESCVVGGER